MIDETADRRRVALELREEALSSLSVLRNNQLEITSARQLTVLEDAGQRILSLRVNDDALNDEARSMVARAAAGRGWTWVDVPMVVVLTLVSVVVGVGAAVLGGMMGNVVLAVLGVVASSALSGAVVIRYRRENWRIRAEQIAPMIWQHGV